VYNPDSTISDTELERQQQLLQSGEFYMPPWNNHHSGSSPKRPNLDERINRLLSGSPTSASQMFYADGYAYPLHDNQEIFYQNAYHQQNMQQMPPPPFLHGQQQQQQHRYLAQSAHPISTYDSFNNFNNFVNNSNLVEITQQCRDRQRGGHQVAVQVGNNLEIVPSSPPEVMQMNDSTVENVNQMRDEKRIELARQRRKAERERKRVAKHLRKEKLRQLIQRYLDANITADDSDDETLISVQHINMSAVAEKSIIKFEKDNRQEKKSVMFSDGIVPGETSSDDNENENGDEEHNNNYASDERRVKFRQTRKKRKQQLIKERFASKHKRNTQIAVVVDCGDLERSTLVSPPPNGMPPTHLRQPRLRKIEPEMFAKFPIDEAPIFYTFEKIKRMQQLMGPPSRVNDRFHYYKGPPPSAAAPHHQPRSSGMPLKANSGEN